MAKLKFKSNGKWESIAAFQGEPGKDGAIQYTAGEGITIEDNVISVATEGGSIPKSAIYQLNTEKYLSVPGTYKTQSMLDTIGEAFTKYFNGETGIPTFRITAGDSMCFNPDYLFDLHQLNKLDATYYATRISKTSAASMPSLCIVKMHFSLTEKDGVYTTNSIDLSYASQGEDLIAKNNTVAYTPASDYHPATKKYVDDSIAAIEIPEGGNVDLSGYATEEYVDNAIANVPIKQIPKVINCNFSDNPTNEYTTQKELYLTDTAKTEITNLINEDMSNPPSIVLRSYNWYAYHLIPLHPEGGGYQNSVFNYSGMYAISPTKINFYHLSINGGIQSGTFVSSTWYLKVKTLDISKYATKEDVNNAITSAITTALEADY